MKFSVLLPTRNRLEYLRYAVATVRQQDYDDWEIIVSDNCSEDDIAGFVASLDDQRVLYFRTDRFVPVTDNWNNALDHATGDYVIMLGDDDGLLPSYFTRMLRTFTDFPDPDFVYTGAMFYAYPGVMPDEPEGFLRLDVNRVFTNLAPAWLDNERARAVTRGYLDFAMPVASNMQFSLISRGLIVAMTQDGPFFRSPYPDFYATPAMFLTAKRILVHPETFVVIGITAKSYGYFHFNDNAKSGLDFLNNQGLLDARGAVDAVRLPGTSYNDSWLLANEALAHAHTRRQGMEPDFQRYRWLQIVHSYKHRFFDRNLDAASLRLLRCRLTVLERLTADGMAVGFSVMRLLPRGLAARTIAVLRRLIGQHPMSEVRPTEQRFRNLAEVYTAIAASPEMMDRKP